nr:DUF1566 domain-containing protein [Rheinheimera baltica]
MLVPFKLMINKFFTLFFASVILFSCSIKATEASSVIGTDGRDMIVADSVTTRVEAGRGDDFIIGGVGDNTYVISKDDGADTIYELSGNNTVEFDAGISFSDIASGLMKSGDDLVLRIGQGGQTLTVKFFFSHSNTINQFRLSNGQTISNAQLFGAFGMAAPTATAALPELVTAQAPDSELTGSANAEVLIARHGTLLMQSLAGNDILVPRGPAVTMEFGLNSGKNLIVAYEGNNTILFGADVAFNDIAMNLRRSGDDLQLINSQDGSEVTVYQFFTRANTISQIRFTSGGDIDAAQLFGLFGVAPPEQAHHYYMVAPGVSFDNNAPGEGNGDGGDDGGGSGGGDDGDGSGGGEDPDPCQGDSCDTGDETNFVIIDGTAQDDLLISDERASLFRAGTGNDIMLGGAGNNRYVIAKGDGADVIIDTEGSNEVHFAADIAWSDISSGLVRSGNDLMLRIGQSGQTLTIQSFFTLANTIELFKLDSGQTLTRQQLFPIFSATAPSQSLPARQLILGRSGETLLQGTEGGDILLNRMAVTSIDAKAGDDIIIAQYTAPSYETDAEGTVYSWDEQRLTLQFEAGHGKDVVYTLGDTALKVHLNFAEGVSRQTVFQNMRRMANDLIIKTYSAADELRFVNFFSHYNHLAEMKFADDDGVSIYDTDIYEGFNSEQPEQPLQLVVGLSGNTLLSCEDLFSRHDSAALSDFQHDVDLNIQPPSNLVASIHRKTFIPFTVANANDVLTCFMLESAPAQMTMHPDSGVLSWAPERGDIGTKDITITVVTDGQTYNQAQFTLLVPDLNQPPVFTNNPKNVAFATVSFEDRISAADNDNYNDAIEFSLVIAPAGLTLTPINNTQADILWQPNAEQVGTHNVVIRAQDKYGKYSELAYNIEVKTFYTLADLPPGYSRVPKTGVTSFNSPLEDGATQIGTDRVFERDHEREVVTDRVSGLVWQDDIAVTEIKRSHSGGQYYCSNLELGGITDWRLPTRLEMAYLTPIRGGALNRAFKNQARNNSYYYPYLAEEVGRDSGIVNARVMYNTLSFNTGEVHAINYNMSEYVRCVSGEKHYKPVYKRIEQHDVVIDTTHRLMWEDGPQIARETPLLWPEAAQICEDTTLAGFTDWRLPNRNESHSLLATFDAYGGAERNGSPRMPSPFRYLPKSSVRDFGYWPASNPNIVFYYRSYSDSEHMTLGGLVNQSTNNKGYPRCVRTYAETPETTPVAKWIVPEEGWVNGELQFDASQSYVEAGSLSFAWYLDNALISESAITTISFEEPGSYAIRLVVTSDMAVSKSLETTINITSGRSFSHCPTLPVTDDLGYNGLYPQDNIAWTGGNAETVDDIARAFNYARSLDPSVHQYLLMPEQAQWDAMSVQQKGLYLVNAERVARGIKPYAGFDAAMVEVAQTYATYIQSRNQVIGHYNDGRSPMQRMQAHSYIGANADSFISKPESVAGATDPNPISDNIALAKAIYFWLYYDKDWFVAFGIDGTPWGHRNHLLQTGLDDNHADNTTEGVVGFGLAKGLYQPGVNPVIKQGAVTVFKTIDQGPNWDSSRIQTVDVSQAQGCPVHQLEVDVNEAELSGLRQLTITPASVHLALGQSTQLTVTGIYSDGSQRDLTALAQFKADAYSVVSVQNGVLYAEQAGDTTVSVSLAGIESNRVYISIGEPADTTILNGTEAEPLKAYIAENATVRSINPLAVAVYSGVVQDRYGYPMADVQLSLLNASEYGSVKTNADGRFMLAGPAGEQTVVYEKPGYVVLQRSTIGASSSWAALPNVTLLERDSKQSLIDLTAGTAQVHQSSVISDEFGERRATVVFNGITSAEIRSQNGARRPISQFMFSATEFETPASMPGELPAETAFTWASDLHVDGTHYTDSVHYNADVVLYLDNFLGFPVGEIVPVGYFDRTISKWIASPNGVVVRLLDTNGDGTVDGVDYNDDGIADDINSDGITADEAIGLTGYAAGDTLWRAAFDHMTPYDLNWSAGSDGRDPNNPDADANGETELDIEECTAVGSYVTPKPLVLHDDIGITGTGIALHYSSQRTAGYQHKITATVSDDELPPGVVEMIATLEVAGRLFEQRFAPAINQQVEFIWDGTNAAGKRVEGGVRAQLRIGYAYPAAYLSSGNAASSGQPLSSFPMAWAQWGQTVTNVAGRENDVRWSSNVVPLFNIPQSPIANGWSLSEHHVLSPFNRIYLGDGSTMDVEAAGKVLKTGITESQYPGDDGSYQQFGADISYSITSHGTVQDNVTGLQWQHLTSPAVRFATKAQANSYCAALPQNPDTALPWRLPTSKEVAYTIDKAANVQFMAMYTTEMQSYWKQNTYNPDNRMIPALCVSGEPLDEKYSRELQASPADEVVVDSATGLMWQDSPANSSLQFGWQQAIDYCENLDHAGFEDWRLPNVNELSYALPNTVFSHQTSLPEMQQGRPWSPGVDFRRPYWASTPNVMAAATQAWALESAGYSHHRYEHTEQYYARCVRNDLTRIKSPYVFDRSGKHVRTLDQVTGKVLMHFDYNSAGQLVAVRDRFDNSLTIRRDSNGVATELETSDGYITRLNVDHQHDLRAVQYADNSAYSFSYVNGQIIEKRDPNGHLFSRGYDQHGRISYSDDSEGGIWRFFSERDAYTGNLRYGYTTAEDNLYETQLSKLSNGDLQQRIRFTDDSLQQSIRAADGLRNSYQSAGVSSVVDKTRDAVTGQPIPANISNTMPSGLQQQTVLQKQYGSNGTDTSRVTVSINTNGKVSTIHNDAVTGVKIELSAAQREVVYQYDPQTLLLSSVQVSGLATEHYRYDSRGRLVQTHAGDRLTQFEYAAHGKGNVTAVTDAEGYVTEYSYDVMGRVTSTRYPDGTELVLSYDSNGNVSSLTPPGQPAHQFHYNGVGNESAYTPPAVAGATVPTTHYHYDRDRKLTGITRPDSQQINFSYATGSSQLQSLQAPQGDYAYSYNTHGQLTAVTSPYGIHNSYSYDGNLPLTESWSGLINGEVSYSYNNDFAVTAQCINGGDCVAYSYDADGLITAAGNLNLTLAAQQGGVLTATQLGNISSVLEHNDFAELNSVTSRFNSQPLHSMALVRDNLGRITRKTEIVGADTVVSDYHYNSNGRLYKVVRNGDTVEYSFDANGNRLSKTSGSGVVSASYDAQDRLLTHGTCSYSYSANGELQQKQCGDAVTQYQYDVFGNLQSVTLPDSGAGVTSIEYLIDASNRRVGKTVNGTVQYGLLYGDQLNPVAQLDANNNVVARFVYGSLGNVPDYMVKGGITYRFITDQLGSVRLVVNSQTGDIAQQLSYDEFGIVTQDTNPGFQPFGWAGGLYDTDTGLTRFGARDYDPVTGRWTSKDPIRFGGGDSNLYGYVLGDPVNFIDPTGEILQVIVGRALFGAAKEFLWQVVIEGRSLGCVDYWQVGAAALQGAFTGGVGPRGIKAGKGEVFYKTTGEATAAAKKLGFVKIKDKVHDQAVYYNRKTKEYISRDVGSGDGNGSHNGGVWKKAKSVKELGSNNTRGGTFDAALNKIGK